MIKTNDISKIILGFILSFLTIGSLFATFKLFEFVLKGQILMIVPCIIMFIFSVTFAWYVGESGLCNERNRG